MAAISMKFTGFHSKIARRIKTQRCPEKTRQTWIQIHLKNKKRSSIFTVPKAKSHDLRAYVNLKINNVYVKMQLNTASDILIILRLETKNPSRLPSSIKVHSVTQGELIIAAEFTYQASYKF